MKLGDRKFVDLGYQRPELLFATLPCNQLSVSTVIVDSENVLRKAGSQEFPPLNQRISAIPGEPSWSDSSRSLRVADENAARL